MDIKRAELPLLLSLNALLSELNVTRAAKRLHISQSTLSGHLARLRESFRDPLLVPSENGRGMVPTPRALAMQHRLDEALTMLRELTADPDDFDPAHASRTFVVAAKDTVVGLDVMVNVMRQGNPSLRMTIVTPSDVDLVDRMASGEIDLYVCDIAKIPGTLKVRPLATAEFAMALRRSHPRGMESINLDEYCRLDHVIMSERGDLWTPIDDALLKLGLRRNIVAAVPSYHQLSIVLSQTDGVATLPRPLLQRYEGILDAVDVPFRIQPFRLAMAWHPRAHEDRAGVWLRGCFLKMQGLAHA